MNPNLKNQIKRYLLVLIVLLAMYLVSRMLGVTPEDDGAYNSVPSYETSTDTSKQIEDVQEEVTPEELIDREITDYRFRNRRLLDEHFEKHGREMGFSDAKAYEEAASDVVNNPEALHKIEEEDGDDVYYLESTNDFVIVSTDGFIRTYYRPNSGIDYFNRQ